jgi:hypothetical protein
MTDFLVAGIAGFVAGLAVAGAFWVALAARFAAVRAVATLLRRAEDETAGPLSEPAAERSLRQMRAFANQLLTLDVILIAVALIVIVSYAAAPIGKQWWLVVGTAAVGVAFTRLPAVLSRRRTSATGSLATHRVIS